MTCNPSIHEINRKKLKIMEHSTFFMDLSHKSPNPNTLTQKEKNFINRLFLEINIDFDTDTDLRIETDPTEFGLFLIGVVRKYLRK